MEGRILREKESGWVDADRCFCSLSTSPCAVVVSLLPFRFPCTRCPVFVNTRPVNSKASKLRAVCHTTHHETHFVLVRVVQTFLFMHFSYLGQTSVSLSLSPVPLIHQPDSRYETDKRCFPLLSLFPNYLRPPTWPAFERSRRSCSLEEVVPCHRGAEQFLINFPRSRKKRWNNNSENERKFSYGGQWKEILRNFLNYTKYLFHSNVYIYIYSQKLVKRLLSEQVSFFL